MGRRPSAEIPGEDNGAILGNDQLGQVYANIRLVAENIANIVTVSTMDPVDLAAVADNIATISAAVTAAANAATSETNAASSATAASTSAANALAYRNTAQASATTATAAETNALSYKNLAEGFKNSASASAIAAATSETNAAASATAAANSATAASGSATTASAANTAAQAAKTAAETAETNAELAETNAEAAQAAALLAQAAAEAARDEAAAIVGGDYVTTATHNADLATKMDKAGGTFTGKVNAVASGAGSAGFNLGQGTAPSAPVDGDLWVTTEGLFLRRNSATYTMVTTFGGTFTGDVVVPAEAYGVAWNGSNEAPTKDAIYDEIEALKTLVVGSVKYISTWNASTNSPTIPAAAAGNKGFYYKVSVAGATLIDGITDWKVGDWIISTGTAWEKVDNTDQVSLVNGQSGAVILNGNDLLLTGYASGANTAIAATDTINAAFGKTQGQLDGKLSLTGGTLSNNLVIERNAAAQLTLSSTNNDGTGNERAQILFHNVVDDGWMLQSMGDQAEPEFRWRTITAGVGGTDVMILSKAGDLSLSGNIVADSAQFPAQANFILAKNPGTFPTVIQRVDSTVFYILLSDANAAINSTYNALRPLSINLTSGVLTSSNGQVFNGGTSVSSNMTLLTASGGIIWNDGTEKGRIYMSATGAVYRNTVKHLFRNADGSADWAEINATGIAVPGQVSVSGATGALVLGDQDLTGSLSLYNAADVLKVYINGADRFSVDSSGNVVAGGSVAATGFTIGGTSVLARSSHTGTQAQSTITNLTNDLAAKADAFTNVASFSTSQTAADSWNNSHRIASGASRVLTLNGTPSVGCSFSIRFTTAWTITCTSLSKNGAAPVSGGSVAANKLVTFLHEGGGTWLASGDIT